MLGRSADPFQRVAFLIGRWRGTTEGQPGKGTVTREYSRALNARFIRVKNQSTYPPQSANPKGEVHEDEGATAQKVVFTSEQIENIPAGFRARETDVVIGPDSFEEIFELAEPGKPFEVYSRARFTRNK